MMILPAPRSVRRSRDQYVNVDVSNNFPRIPPAVQGSFGNRILSGLGQIQIGSSIPFPRPPSDVGGEAAFKTSAFVQSIISGLNFFSDLEGVKQSVTIKAGQPDPSNPNVNLTTAKVVQVDKTVSNATLESIARGSEIANAYKSGVAPSIAMYGKQIAAWLYLNYRPIMRWAGKLTTTQISPSIVIQNYDQLVSQYPTIQSVAAILTSPGFGFTGAGTAAFTPTTYAVNIADQNAIRRAVVLALRMYILLSLDNAKPAQMMTADMAKIQFSLVDSSALAEMKSRYEAAMSKYDAAKAKFDEIAEKMNRGVHVPDTVKVAADSNLALAAQSINSIADKYNELLNYKNEWEGKISQRLYIPISELTAAEVKLATALTAVNGMLQKLSDGTFVAPTDLQQATLALETAVSNLKKSKEDNEGWFVALAAGLNSLILAGKKLSEKGYKSQNDINQLKQELESVIEESKSAVRSEYAAWSSPEKAALDIDAAKAAVRSEYANTISQAEADAKVEAAVAPLRLQIEELEAFKRSVESEYIKISELSDKGYILKADADAAMEQLRSDYNIAKDRITELQAQIAAAAASAGGESTSSSSSAASSAAPKSDTDSTKKAAGAALAVGIPVALLATGPIGIAAAAAAFLFAKNKK
jgi:hypothetical protein